MQTILCIDLISLYVRMFIPCMNEHCDHYFRVIVCFWSSYGLLLNSILHDRITSFLHTMIIVCCCVSGDTCSYGSRTS